MNRLFVPLKKLLPQNAFSRGVSVRWRDRVKNRDQLQQKPKEAGIPTAVHYPIPLNKQPAVANAAVQLPVGDEVAEEVMSLPMYTYIQPEQQKHISQLLSM